MKRKQIKVVAGILMTALLISGCQSNSSSKEDTTAKITETVTETPQETETPTATATATATPTAEATVVPAEEKETDDTKDTTEEGNEQTKADDGDEADDTAESSGDNKAVVQLYEGTYGDYRFYMDLDDNTGQRCTIEITDVTDTSFDFAVYDVTSNGEEDKSELIFKKHTAKFLPGGKEAIYEGKEYTLHFTFPDNHSAYPIVTDIEVTGFAPLEGSCYQNNGIPGHEFS